MYFAMRQKYVIFYDCCVMDVQVCHDDDDDDNCKLIKCIQSAFNESSMENLVFIIILGQWFLISLLEGMWIAVTVNDCMQRCFFVL